jgi:hypothetical protein
MSNVPDLFRMAAYRKAGISPVAAKQREDNGAALLRVVASFSLLPWPTDHELTVSLRVRRKVHFFGASPVSAPT